MKRKKDTSHPAFVPPYVIGVGASAGGLEALQDFLSHVPDSLRNISIIITQHLSPSYKSMLVQLLSRSTKRTVVEIESGMRIEPNIVYITPPDNELVIKKYKLLLNKSAHVIGPKPSIDAFFTALALELKNKTIGIILSGTGSDGANGIRAIKRAGGLTIVQEPQTAKYDGMPVSAIRTEAVDLVLAPEKIGEEIREYLTNPSYLQHIETPLLPTKDAMTDILNLLSKRTQTDFSKYKQTTIVRRLEKRLSLLKMTSLEDYVKFVKENPTELNQLFQTVLIGVTEFFRDTEAIASLEKTLESIIARKAVNEPIRIWVCGCSTGEEAYSIAIIVSNILRERVANHHIQIFATDIDEKALETARRGVFPASSVENVPSKLIKTYFVKLPDGKFEVSKSIRAMILFSKHDATANPPFLKLDMVSCRNLLIYFNIDLQKYILSVFHYALNIEGILFLGKSETVGQYGDLFSTVDGASKIFKRTTSNRSRTFAMSHFQPSRVFSSDPVTGGDKGKMSVTEMVKETLFKTYEYPFVIINENFEIQEIYGDVRLVLNLGEGIVNMSILKLIDKQLNLELHSILTKAVKDRVPVKGKIRGFEFMERKYYVKIIAKPLLYTQQSSELFIIIFEFFNDEEETQYFLPPAGANIDPRLEEMEKELQATREHLQTYVEELETSNEELQSLNEELQSTNEELQSSNEELETSNEELQSTNEELQTAYVELKQLNSLISGKDEELKRSAMHLTSLINSNPEGLMLLDTDFRILTYNRSSVRMFRNFFYKKLKEGESIISFLPASVLGICSEKLTEARNGIESAGNEFTIPLKNHGTAIIRINFFPVFNDAKKVVSIITNYLDVTNVEMIKGKLAVTEKLLSSVFKVSRHGICITDEKGMFVDFNDAYLRIYGYRRSELIGRPFTTVVPEPMRKKAVKLYQQFMKDGTEPPAEWTVVRKSGKEISIRVEATMLKDDRGDKFKVTSIQPIKKRTV
ncbi:MAG: PAS domain S-box protein [Bacteroidetes bacterium]|nr:PAS domain S-box protein [Bacteroidota bacterium]